MNTSETQPGGSLKPDGSAALATVLRERKRQDAKWGVQNHEPMKWLLILGEEYGEACQAILDHSQLEPWSYRYELVQCAAVALAAIEAFDRRYLLTEHPTRAAGGIIMTDNEIGVK